jgi:hypothetical protein
LGEKKEEIEEKGKKRGRGGESNLPVRVNYFNQSKKAPPTLINTQSRALVVMNLWHQNHPKLVKTQLAPSSEFLIPCI